MTRRDSTAFEKSQATRQVARDPRLLVIVRDTTGEDGRPCDRHVYLYHDGPTIVRRAFECPCGREPRHIPAVARYQ